MEIPSVFWLADYRVQPLEGTITSPDGKVSHVQKKPMEVLLVLVEGAGQVVTSDQIIDQVWGSASGGDEGLKRCIHAVRKALGDRSSDPRLIRTVRGRGYSCIPEPVFDEDQQPAIATARQTAVTPHLAAHANAIRPVTAVSVIVFSHGSDQGGPIALFDSYIKALGQYNNGYAYDVGASSTFIFGLNKTQEDDHLSAVEFALAIQKLTADFADSTEAGSYASKIGIASGNVQISQLENLSQPVILGSDTLATATRLAESAGPGKVIVSADTVALGLGQFQSDVVTATVPGLYELNHRSQKLSQRSNSTEFIGRNRDIEALLTSWSQVSQGEGQVFYISGEPGIGKSTLIENFIERVETRKFAQVSRYLFLQRESHSPLQPIKEEIWRSFDLANQDNTTAQQRMIGSQLEQLGFSDPLASSVLEEFLGLDSGNHPEVADIAPGPRKNLLFELLTKIILASQSPTQLIIWDDFQWADVAAQELMAQIVAQGPIANTLIVVAARNTMPAPAWIGRSHINQVNLSGLSKAEASEIVRQVDKNHVLDHSAINRIISHSTGNPLFVEEITRSLLSSRSVENELSHILSNPVRHIFLSRIESLGEEKHSLKAAAIIGDYFDLNQLSALVDVDIAALEIHLSLLVNAELIYQTSSYPLAKYRFKHGLLHAATYESITPDQRRPMHKKLVDIAEATEGLYSKNYLAFHYQAASEYQKAAYFWFLSANEAKNNTLFVDASSHYQKASDALKQAPWSVERDEMDLQIRIESGPILMAIKGYSDDSVKNNYIQAEKLAGSLAEKGSAAIPQALFGLWSYKVVKGELHQARAIGEKLIAVAEAIASDDLALEANVLLGVTDTHLGYYDEAKQALKKAMSIYDLEAHAGHKYIFGQDPGMASHIYYAMASVLTGDSAAYKEYVAKGLIIARRVEHPNSLCFALSFSARCELIDGDTKAAIMALDELTTLSQHNEFPLWIGTAAFLQAYSQHLAATEIDKNTVEAMFVALNQTRELGNSLAYIDYAAATVSALLDVERIDDAKTLAAVVRREIQQRMLAEDEYGFMQFKRAEQRLSE
ncbi:AAA family ATPase [Oceanicoccus sagamiensis]|uniref:OmpR/PhoB-type domain-containing protein n=1 Tax=Oceanicoccus sagamiensis TaxID=716816 RepID=A0A1X9NFB3_9GAMM|nr:AAA family ATPase [Oceanicoccus sagamiensis]ARN75122.1 hypothetical protein BST96_13960 [Oceanicoccus sagamiensis]